MAKDARIPMRVPDALKTEFEWAAAQDGAKGVSTWLRQLGEERAEELRDADRRPMTLEERTAAQRAINAHLSQHLEHAVRNGTAPLEPGAGFVPGYGLDEEET